MKTPSSSASRHYSGTDPIPLIAGHNHYDDYSERNGRDHIVMATTGGI